MVLNTCVEHFKVILGTPKPQNKFSTKDLGRQYIRIFILEPFYTINVLLINKL